MDSLSLSLSVIWGVNISFSKDNVIASCAAESLSRKLISIGRGALEQEREPPSVRQE